MSSASDYRKEEYLKKRKKRLKKDFEKMIEERKKEKFSRQNVENAMGNAKIEMKESFNLNSREEELLNQLVGRIRKELGEFEK